MLYRLVGFTVCTFACLWAITDVHTESASSSQMVLSHITIDQSIDGSDTFVGEKAPSLILSYAISLSQMSCTLCESRSLWNTFDSLVHILTRFHSSCMRADYFEHTQVHLPISDYVELKFQGEHYPECQD